MLDAVLAFLPITVLMVGALITKRIAEMMVLASVLGAVLVYREDFFSGFIDMMYGALSNSSYQFVLIILIGFGGMIRLFQESGALMGFSRIVSGFASGPRKPLLVAWAMAFVMFVDDYLSTLAVSFSMKSITDENRIPTRAPCDADKHDGSMSVCADSFFKLDSIYCRAAFGAGDGFHRVR